MGLVKLIFMKFVKSSCCKMHRWDECKLRWDFTKKTSTHFIMLSPDERTQASRLRNCAEATDRTNPHCVKYGQRQSSYLAEYERSERIWSCLRATTATQLAQKKSIWVNCCLLTVSFVNNTLLLCQSATYRVRRIRFSGSFTIRE
jgi:hypothetical protein